MALRTRAVAAMLFVLSGACGAQAPGVMLPEAKVSTLAGQALNLPGDLAAPVTIFIVGFGRHSQDATTAWERPVRMQLAKPGAVDFYDVAMLAEVPGFMRPVVMRMVRRQVPDVLKPNFVALTEKEDEWKRVSGYSADQPEAAYVLLVDHFGKVRWATHAAFSTAGLDELRRRAAQTAGNAS